MHHAKRGFKRENPNRGIESALMNNFPPPVKAFDSREKIQIGELKVAELEVHDLLNLWLIQERKSQ